MSEPKRASSEPSDESAVADTVEHPRRVAGHGRFRWAVLWTTLGTLIPGLGLWHAGRKVAGSIVMGLFAALVITVGYLATGGRDRVYALAANVDVLNGVAIGMIALAVLWVVVIATTHLALRPVRPTGLQRGLGGALVLVLSLAVATPLAVGAEYSHTAAVTLGSIFDDDSTDPAASTSTTPGSTATADPWNGKDRINVLVIGGDSGTNRDPSLGLRADAVMMASIDTRTGAATLFSLPRQTSRIPFPKGSVLHDLYPNGFYDGVNGANDEYFLNAMYKNIPPRLAKGALGPNVKNVGAEVMKIGVGEALGLGKADYYVIINMDGFKSFINALGGITLNVNYRIPMGGKTSENIPPKEWIEPGPNQHMNGRYALWYARGRYHVKGADYSRMERQRCVINAVVQQAKPEVVLANFEKIASASTKTISTDIPRSKLPALIDLAMKVKGTNLHSVVFQPGVVGWVSANPPWAAVQRRVQQALKEADKAESHKTATASASPSATESTSAKPTKKSTTAGKTDDLSDSCAYHPVKD